MVSIPSCTNGAANTSGGICQPPAKAVVVALGALTFVGAGAALLLGKLPRNVALGAMGAGAVTGLAAAFLWPTPESKITGGGGGGGGEEPLPAVDLRVLVASLGGELDREMARGLTELKLSDIKDMRNDWESNQQWLVDLIEASPNLKTIDLGGFTELFVPWGSKANEEHVVIRALARSSVEKIVVTEVLDEFLFESPSAVEKVLSDGETSYLPRLTVFNPGWAKGQGGAGAIALMKAMPHLTYFGGSFDDTEGLDELFAYIRDNISADNVSIGGELVKGLRQNIVKELAAGEASEWTKAYMAAEEVFRADEWNYPGVNWPKLTALVADNVEVDLQSLDADVWTDALADAVKDKERVIIPWAYELDFNATNWGSAALARFKCQYVTGTSFNPPDQELTAAQAKAVTDYLDWSKIDYCNLPKSWADIPDPLFEAIAQVVPEYTRLPMLDPTDARLEGMTGGWKGWVSLAGDIQLTSKGMTKLIECGPASIRFDPSNPDQQQLWFTDDGIWNMLEQGYEIEVHYTSWNAPKEEWLENLDWAGLKQDPTYLNGERQSLSGTKFEISLKKKDA